MHVRLPQSLISMSIQKLYTNRSSFAESARFSRPGASLSIIANVMQEKITVLTPALLVPDPLLSICRSEIQITSTSLLILENVPFSN